MFVWWGKVSAGKWLFVGHRESTPSTVDRVCLWSTKQVCWIPREHTINYRWSLFVEY